ncbi:neurogenic differentiation factor 4 [Musca domestica]|uniref:Neurogenic differentiation factor 4 n=1 Tax=Musca domestica TaxID=7370 RepID=A0A1I8MV63_MUSDO|nr:neurogenic differentiation factor 4 [Musca domestica]
MPRKKRAASPFELMDDDYDEDASSQSSRNDNPPVQRNAANARERARMRVLSSAFGRLKTKLPNIPSDTKLSKLDTLRLATMYIKQLKAVVEGNAPLNTNSAMGEAEINGGPSSLLGDTPNCFLQLHSGAANMNWPFGLHHQVNHHSSASTNRSQTYNTSYVTNGTPTWCQTETNPAKKTRFDTENYQQQQQQPINPHNHEQQQENPPYLLTLISSSTPPTPPNSQPADNTIWYSETPSPDLSSSTTTTTSSSNGIGGYDGPSHHHPHQTLPHHHSNILLEHHLAHMQLTPPHSNANRSYPQHHHQHHASLAHQHQHYSQQQHHQQYSHHLPPLSGDGRQHELQYINSNNLTAASIR